jgi:hypothetical protein
VRRRRWLLELAERAAYAHLAFHAPDSPWTPLAERPSVDEVLELTLRLEGTAPFLLRPGERAWLQATTALLAQTAAP